MNARQTLLNPLGLLSVDCARESHCGCYEHGSGCCYCRKATPLDFLRVELITAALDNGVGVTVESLDSRKGNYMRDLAYEDLETEAVKEREENEAYEAECAKAGGLEKNEHLFHIPAGPKEPLEPTPTKAQKVKEVAELTLKLLKREDGARYLDCELLRMITLLAEAIDKR